VEGFAYSFEAHVDWLHEFVCALDLRGITLIGQDWGGPIGLAVLAREPARFARVVAANTILHTAEPELAGRLCWANHGVGESEVRLAEGLLDWMTFSQRSPVMEASAAVGGAVVNELPAEALAAYDAPFPEERAKAGLRQFPILIPVTRSDPGAALNRATWRSLASFEGPFLTVFGDSDPTTAGWEAIFRERVPGAAGQPHAVLRGAGHFLQEDAGQELARRIVAWMGTEVDTGPGE
jgi:haloalkane dehalogenase